MIQALRDLFPVLVLLYLVDAFVRAGAWSLLFVSRPGRGFGLAGPGLRLGALLPSDAAFVVSRPPLLPGRDGVFWMEGQGEAGPAWYDPAAWSHMEWDGAGLVEAEGDELRLGRRRAELSSAAEAASWAGLVERLRGLAPGERETALAAHRAWRLHLAEARERWSAFRRDTRLLPILGTVLFLLLYLLLPAALYLGEDDAGLPRRLAVPVLVLAGLVWIALAAAAVRTGRALRRRGHLGSWITLVPVVLSPPAATRALSSLGRDLFQGLDPLAVAAVLLPRPALLRLARAELHGAATAIARGEDLDWRGYWRDRRERLLVILDQAGVPRAEALAAPPRRDPGAQGYCPVCDVELGGGQQVCGDCGLPLLAAGQG